MLCPLSSDKSDSTKAKGYKRERGGFGNTKRRICEHDYILRVPLRTIIQERERVVSSDGSSTQVHQPLIGQESSRGICSNAVHAETWVGRGDVLIPQRVNCPIGDGPDSQLKGGGSCLSVQRAVHLIGQLIQLGRSLRSIWGPRT